MIKYIKITQRVEIFCYKRGNDKLLAPINTVESLSIEVFWPGSVFMYDQGMLISMLRNQDSLGNKDTRFTYITSIEKMPSTSFSFMDFFIPKEVLNVDGIKIASYSIKKKGAFDYYLSVSPDGDSKWYFKFLYAILFAMGHPSHQGPAITSAMSGSDMNSYVEIGDPVDSAGGTITQFFYENLDVKAVIRLPQGQTYQIYLKDLDAKFVKQVLRKVPKEETMKILLPFSKTVELSFDEKVTTILSMVRKTIKIQPRKVGKASEKPLLIFNKSSAETGLFARLDNKLSSLQNQKGDPTKEDTAELISYLVNYAVSSGWSDLRVKEKNE
jgi:hypothetical protein